MIIIPKPNSAEPAKHLSIIVQTTKTKYKTKMKTCLSGLFQIYFLTSIILIFYLGYRQDTALFENLMLLDGAKNDNESFTGETFFKQIYQSFNEQNLFSNDNNSSDSDRLSDNLSNSVQSEMIPLYQTIQTNKTEERSPSKSKSSNKIIQASPENVNKNWIIIAFSDSTYYPAARIWYNQLKALGYENHYLIALDDQVYEKCLSENIRTKKASSDFNRDPKSLGPSGKLSRLWSIRLTTIFNLLRTNVNVFISDVDSIWLKHQNLNLLPFPSLIDIYHGLGTKHPLEVYLKYGFVVCGCIGAYRSNERVIEFFRQTLSTCYKNCDDQVTINNLYKDKYQFEWWELPGMGMRMGRQTSGFRGGLDDENRPLTAMTLSESEVVRGKPISVDFNSLCGLGEKSDGTNNGWLAER